MSTDPAVDAAYRARYDEDGDGVMYSSSRDAMEEAAREALAPIQKLVEVWYEPPTQGLLYANPDDAANLIDALRPLIYPSEELT